MLRRTPGGGYRLCVDGRFVHNGPRFAEPRCDYTLVCSATAPTATNARAEVTAYSFTQPRVVGQNPPAGTLVPNKTAVDLTIVEGPATETVPNVIGLTRAEADAAIVAANLKVGAVIQRAQHHGPRRAGERPVTACRHPRAEGHAGGNRDLDGAHPIVAPVITSAPVTTATAGVLYTYDVEATDPDAGDVLTYSLTTAPAGMTIDPTTGLIAMDADSGPGARSYPVSVRVTDGRGGEAEQTFSINVCGEPQTDRHRSGVRHAPCDPLLAAILVDERDHHAARGGS